MTGKYVHAKHLVPSQMREDCHVVVLKCSDGIFVRYDAADGEVPKVRVAVIPEPLAEVAPKFSDDILHFPTDPANYAPAGNGPRLELRLFDENKVVRQSISVATLLIGTTKFPEGFEMPPPTARPPCLASIQNEFDILLGGTIEPNVPSTGPRRVEEPTTDFVARSRLVLPVGWRAIEVYPPLGNEYWRPEHAAHWAEQDILATLFQRSVQENELKTLDGRVEARKKYEALLSEFEGLLDGPEEPVHQFLKRNSMLLCPTSDRVWSKVPFGNHVSDFVFREAHEDYLLVEIEAPVRELFRKDGHPRFSGAFFVIHLATAT